MTSKGSPSLSIISKRFCCEPKLFVQLDFMQRLQFDRSGLIFVFKLEQRELRLSLKILNPIMPAPPLRFFAHNSEREKDNSIKFGDFS